MRAGGLAAGLMCAAMLGASAFDRTANVVIAGSVIVDTAATPVQHPTGGIVAEVRRRNGDRVKTGDLLARLDDSAIRSNLLQSANSMDLLVARKARLEAERDGLNEVKFPTGLADRAQDAFVLGTMDHERGIFSARFTARRAENDLQQVRIHLLDDEIAGLAVQEQAKIAEKSLIERELNGIRQLHDQNLAPLTRLIALERDAVRLDAEQRGSLPVAIAQARSRIADTQLQIVRANRDSLRDIANELRDIDERLMDMFHRKLDFEEQLKRAQIVSPHDGIVLSSSVGAAGCQVGAGKDIMVIAPADDRPTIEARVDVESASRLRVGQTAKLLVASGGSFAGELAGRLDRILPAEGPSNDAQVTLRFTLADAQATLAMLPPGTSVDISIATGYGRAGLLGLVPAVAGPLQRFERAFL